MFIYSNRCMSEKTLATNEKIYKTTSARSADRATHKMNMNKENRCERWF